jgi:hypothetical protein
MAASPGCIVVVAGAAGASTVAYIRGELDAPVGKPYEKVVRASEDAIGQLEFSRIRTAKDALTADIVARTAEDRKVEVIVHKETDATTTVKIRVGVFGDEQISRALLENIQANL